MLDSQARSAPGSIDEAVDFRFSITWTTLLAPSATTNEAQTAKATFALISGGVSGVANTLVPLHIVVVGMMRHVSAPG